MYCFKIYNQINKVTMFFFKIIVYEINSEIVKFKMVVLTEREKIDVTVD
jgi:hypothetical protein